MTTATYGSYASSELSARARLQSAHGETDSRRRQKTALSSYLCCEITCRREPMNKPRRRARSARDLATALSLEEHAAHPTRAPRFYGNRKDKKTRLGTGRESNLRTAAQAPSVNIGKRRESGQFSPIPSPRDPIRQGHTAAPTKAVRTAIAANEPVFKYKAAQLAKHRSLAWRRRGVHRQTKFVCVLDPRGNNGLCK